VLHDGRLCKEGAHDGAPLAKGRGLTEVHGVVLKRGPKNLQQIALGGLDATVDFEALKALGLGDDGVHAELDGFVKCGLLTGLDADVDEFENHGVCLAS